VDIIELVTGFEELPNTVMSELPRGITLPTQVHYALVNSTNVSDAADVEGKGFGQTFSLGPLGSPLAAKRAPADVFVIEYHVSNILQEDFDSVLERLIHLAKPAATFPIVGATSGSGKLPSPMLKTKGLDHESFITVGTESLILYRCDKKDATQSEELVNGSTGEKIAIIEPTQ
jgi:hypothetical protein